MSESGDTGPLIPEAYSQILSAVAAILVGVGSLLAGWIYAIGSWGWFLGVSLGWIPSGILAAAAAWIAYKLWPIALAIIAFYALIVIIVIGQGLLA